MSKRQSNFELMRIVSMIFIILWHIIIHGHMLENSQREALTILFEGLKFLIIVHVSSFVLLMVYFQVNSRFKLDKCLKLFLQVVFYALLCLIISIKLGWIDDYNIITFINKFLPSVISEYWFINVYLITYIFSDYLNKFINRLSRLEFRNLLIILFIILSVLTYASGLRFFYNTGYGLYHFIFLYFIGAYLKKYPLKDTYHFKRSSINGYRLILIACFILMTYLNYSLRRFAISTNGVSHIFSDMSNRVLANNQMYSPPFVVIPSICYYEFFRSINIKSNKIINYISSSVFGIYLLHDNNIIRDNIYKLLRIDTGAYVSYKKILVVMLGVIAIFLIGLVIEIIRKLIIYLIKKLKPYKYLKLKFIDYLNSFNFKINW